jgi:tetratricopeptide (TPR) repeat protein
MPHRGIAELLAAESDAWNRPVRLTRGPGADFAADFHAATDRLVYVSDRDGGADLFLQEGVLRGLEPPRKLSAHSARDRCPRLGPRGRWLAFASTREDTAGDIWILRLSSWFLRPRPEKLTGPETADDQPCWHPDGKRIFYASAPSLGQQFDLWQIIPGDDPVRLTHDGGQMPACSPDGRYLAFVSSRGAASPDLWAVRLEDGAATRVTSGPELDLYPSWSADGRRIFFSRVAFDSNGDGSTDQDDAASIFAAAFSDGVFAGEAPAPARQLTSFAFSDSFPRAVPGGFLFTRGLGAGNTDIFALGESGAVPDFAAVSEFVEFASRVERQSRADPHRRMLAWQNVTWAARTAERGGGASSDLDRWGDAAAAWLGISRALLDLGRPEPARAALEELIEMLPEARRYSGLAQAELLALVRRSLAASANRLRLTEADAKPPTDAAWQEHLNAARALHERFSAYAGEARRRGEAQEARALEKTCALARLELGHTLLQRRQYAEGLEALESVPEQYPDQREACARALLAGAEVYRILGQPEAVRQAYLKVLKDYAELATYAARAAALTVDTIVEPDASFEQRLARLREMVELYADVPVLPALAQNTIGDLHYARKDYVQAIAAYNRTIEQYPGESAQAGAAYLSIGRIRIEQEDYERAVEALWRMQGRFDQPSGWLYERARRGYVNSALLKAQREFQLGDVQLALDTYAGLAAYDPTLAAAHRGVVQCYARLGRVEEAILRYFGPSDWVGDRRAARLRVRIDREALRLVGQAILTGSEVSYYHQLRGFLLSRLSLATGDSDHQIGALDAYMAALGLSQPEDDPSNYANLLFNVGEGYMLVDRPAVAYDYYRRAVDAGFSFIGAHGEAALAKISRSAMAAGDHGFAIRMLHRALAIQSETAADPREAVPRQRRQAETLDRLSLAYHLDGDYAAAVEHYRLYADSAERLEEVDPASAPGYRRNLLRAHRNLAVNLYLAVENGQAPAASLAEAYRLLAAAVERLDAVGVVSWEEDRAPGLLTIDVDIALGRRKATAEFDVDAERRLLYTYMARLNAAAGNHDEAAAYLQKKVALYAELPADTEQTDVLTEQAVTWSQIGSHRVAQGDLSGAAEAYRRALKLEGRAGNLQGEAAAAASLGRLALRAARQPDPPADLAGLLGQVPAMHRGLLERIASQDSEHLIPLAAALETNLAALLSTAGAAGGAQ